MNVFSGKGEMGLKRDLLAFVEHAGFDLFIDFMTEGEEDIISKEKFPNNPNEERKISYDVEEAFNEDGTKGRLDGVIKSETGSEDFLIYIESKRWGQADWTGSAP